MRRPIYLAGGIYQAGKPGEYFGLCAPPGAALPYIFRSFVKARSTCRHSGHVYELTDGRELLLLDKSPDLRTVGAPDLVNLTDGQLEKVLMAIDQDLFF